MLPGVHACGVCREAALAGLRAWVEQIDLVQYRDYFAKLPPCCPHPEDVIELPTVMAAWRRVYGDPAGRACRTPSCGTTSACLASSADWALLSSTTSQAAFWRSRHPVSDH